jgi:hypothetical protein
VHDSKTGNSGDFIFLPDKRQLIAFLKLPPYSRNKTFLLQVRPQLDHDRPASRNVRVVLS